MTATYDTPEAIQAQRAYCDSHDLPHFAPEDGRCPNCFRDIYRPSPVVTAYSVQTAGARHITGCPHCNRSFCE